MAQEKFQAWCAWVRTEAAGLASGLLEPMREAAAMVSRHLEGPNSLFSATKRKARGYRFSKYQIAVLYLVAGKLEIPSY